MSELTAELETIRDSPKQVAKAVVEQVREDDVPFMAGSIAYQAFASLVPILVLLFLFVTVVGDQQLADRVLQLTQGVLPPNAQDLVYNAITNDSGVGGAGASVIGFVTLLWGSLKIFRGLDKAFSEIYETEAENSFLDQLEDGAVVLVALVVGVVGMVGAMSVFAAFGPLSRALSFVALLAGLTLAFLPMYRLFPDADLEWADALPGAAVAAVGWVVLQYVFQLYIGFSSTGDGSGIIGAVLLLLLWLYASGLVLLLAAVVNAVLLGEGGPNPLAETGGDGPTDQLTELREAVHDERDRRQTLEHERARLQRRLERAEEAAAANGMQALERRNRALARRLDWYDSPLHTRLLSRAFGDGPPRVPGGPGRRRRRPGGTEAPGTSGD